jgi:phage major head subunit gpT-like protein
MVASTANFSELLWPGIREIFGDTYQDWPAVYPKIFNVRKSDQAFEKDLGIAGLPLAAIKDEGDNITYASPNQGYMAEYVHLTYALGSMVTKEAYDDDQYGKINQIPKMLARSMRTTEEVVGAGVLNNGFNGAFPGPDGVPLFSTSHPLVYGGVYSNTLATPADLGQTSLEQAHLDLAAMTDDSGIPIVVRPRLLVIPPALQFSAQVLLASAYKPGGNANDINTMENALDVLVNPYLTDPDSWYVLTDADNGLIWFDRESATPERTNDFDTRNLKFAIFRRFSCGWTDPRGIYGSPGV